MKILLGHDRAGGQKVHIPKSSFKTHWHLIGGTGKGKTTAVHTMLHQLLLDPIDADCWFIIDRLGGLSHDLLLWMASDYCTDDVRSRLVYIEPAREDVVIGFNPLLYSTPAEGYYKVTRSTDTILRGWSAQNLAEMPRLARWLFNSMWACAQLGLTVIGGMVINEVLATARGLRPEERSPTFLLLDEFQRFVGPDLVEALPEVRQLELRLILAHQSFSQLVRGDIDLTSSPT